MAVNKVVYGDETLIDLTEDTVSEDTLAEGCTAHDRTGKKITGTMASSGGDAEGDVWEDSFWTYCGHRYNIRTQSTGATINLHVGCWMPKEAVLLFQDIRYGQIGGTNNTYSNINYGIVNFLSGYIPKYEMKVNDDGPYKRFYYTYTLSSAKYTKQSSMFNLSYRHPSLKVLSNGDGTYKMKAVAKGITYPTSQCISSTKAVQKYETESNVETNPGPCLCGSVMSNAKVDDTVYTNKYSCYFQILKCSEVDLSFDTEATHLAVGFLLNQSKLQKITMPSSIEYLDAFALYGCEALELIDFSKATKVPTVKHEALTGIPTTCKIKVPSELYESWKANSSWTAYANQITT